MEYEGVEKPEDVDDKLQCTECGYTEWDAKVQADHNLCPGEIPKALIKQEEEKMTKDELIVKQQLEIEELKKQEADFFSRMLSIYGELYNIGAPLNDNIDGFNAKQRKVFHRIGAHIILNDEEF